MFSVNLPDCWPLSNYIARHATARSSVSLLRHEKRRDVASDSCEVTSVTMTIAIRRFRSGGGETSGTCTRGKFRLEVLHVSVANWRESERARIQCEGRRHSRRVSNAKRVLYSELFPFILSFSLSFSLSLFSASTFESERVGRSILTIETGGSFVNGDMPSCDDNRFYILAAFSDHDFRTFPRSRSSKAAARIRAVRFASAFDSIRGIQFRNECRQSRLERTENSMALPPPASLSHSLSLPRHGRRIPT